MVAAKYIKATGIFIIGVAIIVIGLYMFFTNTNFDIAGLNGNSFYVMAAGLAISGIGSRHGHQKIRSPEFKQVIENEMKEREIRRKEKELQKEKKRLEKEKKEQAAKKEESKKRPGPACAQRP